MSVLYLRAGGRRPIWVGIRPAMRDVQADIPANWCEVCGREVYTPGRCLCAVCIQRKEKEDGKGI